MTKRASAAEISKVKAEFMAEWGPRLVSDEVPISPYRVIRELYNALDVPNSIVTHDSGYPRDQMVPFLGDPLPQGIHRLGQVHTARLRPRSLHRRQARRT